MFDNRPEGEQVWEIVTNNDCNLRCSYCFATNKEKVVMTEENIDNLFEFIENYEFKLKDAIVKVYGGESLIYPELVYKIMDKTLEMHEKGLYRDLRFVLITNGIIYSEKFVDKLAELKKHIPNSSFAISVDGCKSVHDEFRRDLNNNGSFDRISKNIFKYIEYIASKKILKDGADILGLQYVFSPGVIKNIDKVITTVKKAKSLNLRMSELMMNDESYNGIDETEVEYALRRIFEEGNGAGGNSYRIASMDRQIRENAGQRIDCKACSIGIYYHSFLPNGDIYPCSNFYHNGFTSYKLGNLDKKEYNINLALMIHNMKRSRECDSCSLDNRCVGYCIANNILYRKNPSKLNSEVCKVNKIYTRLHDEFREIRKGNK